MLRFYVLTSRKFGCLKRHFRSLPKDQTTVVINSTDDVYVAKAYAWCRAEGIDVTITESNGNPGRGKNSVLYHFLKSDNDYMVQIDGDDFLQPHGVNLYKWIAENDPPDGIQLVYGNTWSDHPNPAELYGVHPWQRNYLEWVESTIPLEKRAHYYYMYEKRVEYQNIFREVDKQAFEWNYPDAVAPTECARLIFYSRKLAKSVTFRDDLLVGEDALVNYQVRDMAWKKKIILKKILDSREKTYSYDLSNSGIVKQTEMESNYEWLQPFHDAVEEASKDWTVPQDFGLSEIHHNIERVPYIDDLGVEDE